MTTSPFLANLNVCTVLYTKTSILAKTRFCHKIHGAVNKSAQLLIPCQRHSDTTQGCVIEVCCRLTNKRYIMFTLMPGAFYILFSVMLAPLSFPYPLG